MKRAFLFLLLQYGFCIEIALAQPNCITIVPWSNAEDYMRNGYSASIPPPSIYSETWILGGGVLNCYAKYNFSTNTIDYEGAGATAVVDPSSWVYFCTCPIPEGVWFRRAVQRLSCSPNSDCDLQDLISTFAITNSSSSASNWSNLTAWTLGQVPNLSSSHALIRKSMNLDMDLCVCSGNAFAIGNSSNFNINSGITLTCNAAIKVISSSQLTNNGILKGIGKILGRLSNAGRLSPGNSAGTFTITGDYTAQGTAVHDMEIASTSSYDIINITGTAILDGALNVSLLSGFIPNIGDQFTLMNYGSETGSFSMLNLPSLPTGRYWHLNYNTTSIILEVTNVLPTELVDFEGKYTEGGNLLTWQTATEQNVSHFDIERSANGKVFDKIGDTKARGKAANYQFLDTKTSGRFATSPTLTTYYRLKINDLDSKTSYSNVVSLVSKSKGFFVKAYPNPFGNDLTVEVSIEKKTDVQIVLTDILGRQVFVKNAENTEGALSLPILIKDLPTGTYFLKVSDGQQTIQQKVIKN